MESTQNKIYEIEDSAQFDQSLKNQMELDNTVDNTKDKDADLYGDQFDENKELGVAEGEKDGIEEKPQVSSKIQAQDIIGPFSTKY